MTDWNDRGNDKDAWDDAYAKGGLWDEHKGGPRTEAFGNALLAWLPPQHADYLAAPGRTILDWGCGLGEITDLLRQRFPEAVVTGLDFSKTGIARAIEAFGAPFVRADSIEDYYDVIIASNVHEHFVDYLGLTMQQMAYCRGRYVILTPYEEHLGDAEQMTIVARNKAGHAHVHRFGDASFPEVIGGFRLASKGLVEPGPLWAGQQLALVYSK